MTGFSKLEFSIFQIDVRINPGQASRKIGFSVSKNGLFIYYNLIIISHLVNLLFKFL